MIFFESFIFAVELYMFIGLLGLAKGRASTCFPAFRTRPLFLDLIRAG